MKIQGTLDPEWLRLYRVAVANRAVSKETAKKTFRDTTPVWVWYQKGKEYDTVYALRVDDEPWSGRAQGSPAYACVA